MSAEPRGAAAVVIGGGIAGLAAATRLAEAGARVTVLERERFLGGRAGAWSERLPDGERFEMERGFHAFFRQYYSLRALLRRADPALWALMPVDDYPILGPDGQAESFADLPATAPWNVAALVRRTPTLTLRDVARTNVRAALAMLTFDPVRTYARWGHVSAREYLDALRFPPAARRMLFDVFAHSFFNPEHEMSAGELLMMFHFYFMGNREGLVFDVSRRPFSHALWEPLRAYLEARGVAFLTGVAAERVERAGAAWSVRAGDERLDADAVVIATHVPGVQALVEASPALGDSAWRRRIDSLALTRPFAVWRLWLDRPAGPGRAPFAGTTGVGPLDNISLYHAIEDESRAWAERTGGAVVELHAYGLPEPVDEAALKADLLAGLHGLYPETREAAILHERFLLRGDCPAFPPGADALRPGVDTPSPGIALAGDFVALPFPSALMERAAASGFLAAKAALPAIPDEPLATIPRRGMLAPRGLGREEAPA
jgi:carotenoid phi-ring synthase / carotenoid chi-ring synthase